MRCANCHAYIGKNDNICPKCGQRIGIHLPNLKSIGVGLLVTLVLIIILLISALLELSEGTMALIVLLLILIPALVIFIKRINSYEKISGRIIEQEAYTYDTEHVHYDNIVEYV